MVLGILYGYIEPLEDQKRLAFLVFVRIVERIQDKPHAHGGASLTDTLLLYQVPHVDKVDEHGREHSLILRVIVTDNAGELAVVDSDGFEQGRRQRYDVFQLLLYHNFHRVLELFFREYHLKDLLLKTYLKIEVQVFPWQSLPFFSMFHLNIQ